LPHSSGRSAAPQVAAPDLASAGRPSSAAEHGQPFESSCSRRCGRSRGREQRPFGAAAAMPAAVELSVVRSPSSRPPSRPSSESPLDALETHVASQRL